VDYFPSYEIIAGHHSRGAYYEDDLREVNARGVAHAMRVFLAHYPATAEPPPAAEALPLEAAPADAVPDPLGDIVCDEEAIERART
jgi:hypothetical protein